MMRVGERCEGPLVSLDVGVGFGFGSLGLMMLWLRSRDVILVIGKCGRGLCMFYA